MEYQVQTNADKRKERVMTLTEKYSNAIQTARNVHMSVSTDEHGGKLYFKGTVKTQDEANRIWDAIKRVPDWPRDIVADIRAVADTRASAARTYTVKNGDTLIKIARETLGDPRASTKIFDANRDQLSNPDQIRPGQILRLP
jgi:nucleoid-associated protein YgaU